ncbi:unnamed protein product [Vitrella brassicaformis CCMP3155]|uniref:Secondary thiamine-phosphate synthase enzyme n=2 Tax=Vitrella brassicaformis TaxID=1169539 RepID=A0A0G4GGH8_VITBC|nr:unnamed protein product [Vitrella brassicaformis CCMP3155]|eukprot:CEM28744.1 unnamed protein product [Vitrella brassicaformis CCMP3155]
MKPGQLVQKPLTIDSAQGNAVALSDILQKEVPLHKVPAGLLSLCAIEPGLSLGVIGGMDGGPSAVETALSRLTQGLGNNREEAIVRASVLGKSLAVPVRDGAIDLAASQEVYLVDNNSKVSGQRTIVATLVPGVDSKATSLPAPSRGCHIITRKVTHLSDSSGGDFGLMNVCAKHSGCSLTINENADADVRTDLEAAFNRLVPEKKGDSTRHANIKSTLVGPSITVPYDSRGSPQLGTWQGVYLNEHASPHDHDDRSRSITVTRLPSSAVAVQKTIRVTAPSRGCHAITDKVRAAIDDQLRKCTVGVVHVFIKHTSASLTFNDGIDAVQTGRLLEKALNHIVPEKWHHEFFQHTLEGPDDMTGHVKSTLFTAGCMLPVADGDINIGGNEVYLCEHRNTGGWGGGHNRSIVITLIGQA